MKGNNQLKKSGKGRPKTADGEKKRESILDSALFFFAVQGISDTTSAQIAEKAGVTSAMIHYYFGNWDGLLDAVVKERIQPKIFFIWEDITEDISFSEVLEIFTERFFAVIEEMPLLPELWNREIFHVGGKLRDRFVRHIPFEKFDAVCRIFREAQERGEVNPLIQPELVILSAISLIMLPLAAVDLLNKAGRIGIPDREALKEHVLALLSDGVKNKGR